MERNVVRRGVTVESRKPVTAYHRALEWIGRELGMKPETVKDQMNNGHSVYQRVATFNRGLLMFGLTEEVATRMAVVDASLAGQRVPSAADAIHAHNSADALEDVEQAEFVANPCKATWEAWRVKLAREMYRISDVIASHDAEYR